MARTSSPLADEHRHLIALVEAFCDRRGKTALAAVRLKPLLRSHFERELESAELLEEHLTHEGDRPLAGHRLAHDARLDSIDRNMRACLRDHRVIVMACERLRRAAEEEGHADVAGFCARLDSHIRIEEGVLYPLALVQARALREAEAVAGGK